MRRPLFLAALFLVIVAAIRLGAGWADNGPPGCISTNQLPAASELLVTGQVYQKDGTSIYLKSIIVMESDASGQSAADSRPEIQCQENLVCELEDGQDVPLGAMVAVRGIFYPYSHATNPGEFDSAVYYRTLEIGGKLRRAHLLAAGEEYWTVREALYRLKCYLKERLCRIFPEKEAAVMSALLLGDKKDLDSELKDLYKRNGILHILSISSLHITIIGMTVYQLLRRTGLPIFPAAVGGSILLFLYGCMTGFSVSACRAIGMYLIKMLGEVVGRTYDMLTALGVMAAVMVIGNPYYLQNSGFLLSFTSVLGIGVVYPALMPDMPRSTSRSMAGGAGRIRKRMGKLRDTLLSSVFASLSITLATLPVQLWFYYEIPVYSVVLNLFVLPFMKPMMITGLLALMVPGLGILGGIDYCILKSYEFLCGCFDRLPFHTWNPGCPTIVQIVVYYLLLAGAVVLRNYMKEEMSSGTVEDGGEERKKVSHVKPYISAGKAQGVSAIGATGERLRKHGKKAASICCVVIAVLIFTIRPGAENSVTFLDVGQGDCILLRTASGENYLFDCGSSSRSSVGKYLLIPYLKYHGIRNIDAVFLSHPDADHVNGAVELLEMGGENHITVKQLLLPAIPENARQEQLGELLLAAAEAMQKEPVMVGYLQAGDSWNCGSAAFTCLHPGREIGTQDVNGYSECFLVEFAEEKKSFLRGGTSVKKWTLLLTGDVQNEGEEDLQREILSRDIKNITVLKAAHHGSKNSTPGELLAQLAPSLTVISSGRNNRYGHPHAELLARLEESGTYIVQTAQSGAVKVTCQGGGIRVETYVHENTVQP